MRALRIFDHGDGTVRIKRDQSFNTLAPMATNELVRFDMDTDPLTTHSLGACASRRGTMRSAL